MDRRRASRSIIALLLFYVFNLAIQYLTSPDPAEVVQPQSVGWYSLYFTNPEGASASTLRGGPDDPYIEVSHPVLLRERVRV